MAGDHVARIRKWHELIERHGSDEAAHYAIRESPEWAMTYELYPSHLLDEGRRRLALDLMIAADKEAGELAGAVATAEEGEAAQVKAELDLGGSYSPLELLNAAKDYAAGKRTIEEVQIAAEISYRRARRLRSWLEAGAIFWDGRTVRAARGYQLTRIDSDPEHPAVRLVRLYPA